MELRRNFLVVAVIAFLLMASAPLFAQDTSLTSSMQLNINSTLVQTGLSTTRDIVTYAVQKSLTPGSGTTQVADLIYSSNITIPSNGTSSLDLNGALSDAFGNTISMARVKFIFIENTSATAAVKIGSNTPDTALPMFTPASGVYEIQAYGVFSVGNPLTGITVAAGSDTIWFENQEATPVTERVWIVGSSQ